jgi:hypothetical protein
MIARLFCRVFSHRWTRWEQESACERLRVCLRCKYVQHDLDHSWGEWRTTDTCDVVRACARCESVERNVRHTWTEWYPDAQCRSARSCVKCSEQELLHGVSDHAWGQWETAPENAAECRRVCTRCGMSEAHSTIGQDAFNPNCGWCTGEGASAVCERHRNAEYWAYRT